MNGGTDISVIIPTRNRTETLEHNLQALSCGSDAAGGYELIICDDGDTEETHAMLLERHPGVRWMRGPQGGPGANRNAAANAATGHWLLFLDDDCIPRPGFLEAYRRSIACCPAGSPVVLAGTTIGGPESRSSIMWEAPHWTGGDSLPPSCNFAMRKADFQTSGGFDERYRISFEDMEFFDRLKRSGYKLAPVPEAIADHPARRIPGASKLADRWEARVISALDLGASPSSVAWMLPRHVAAVIASRFRDRPDGPGKLRALRIFLGELCFVLCRLPGWLRKHAADERSSFWREQVASKLSPPRYGL